MSLTDADIQKIAHLARLNVTADEATRYAGQLSTILDFINQIDQVDTSDVTAIAHALEHSQRLRPDEVTETDQREAFQKIAPVVEAGLYLVPQVIETV